MLNKKQQPVQISFSL